MFKVLYYSPPSVHFHRKMMIPSISDSLSVQNLQSKNTIVAKYLLS